MRLQGPKGVSGREGGLQSCYRRGGGLPISQFRAQLPPESVRHEELYGAPWYYNARLGQDAVWLVLPGQQRVEHGTASLPTRPGTTLVSGQQ